MSSPPDMGGGGSTPPPPPAEGGVTPENFNKNNLDLLLEETLFNGSTYFDLSKGQNSLLEIDDRLGNLLDK